MKNWKQKLLSWSIGFVPGSMRGAIRRIPGVAAAQRFAVQSLGRNEEFEHKIDYGPAKGLYLPIRLPQDKSFWKGTYEEHFCRRLAGAVKAGDVCCDIGAFRGYTAGVMALAGASRVAAFEPAPGNQEVIARVCALNPNLPIDLFRAAVGGEEGEIKITIHEDSSMNFIGEDNSGRPAVEVKMVTLDGLLASRAISAPQLLKIDVEGAEASVLRGAANTLRESVREIFVELHHEQARFECLALLGEAGFESIWQAEAGSVLPVQAHFRRRNCRE